MEGVREGADSPIVQAGGLIGLWCRVEVGRQILTRVLQAFHNIRHKTPTDLLQLTGNTTTALTHRSFERQARADMLTVETKLSKIHIETC